MPSGRPANTFEKLQSKIEARKATLADPTITKETRSKSLKNLKKYHNRLALLVPNPLDDRIGLAPPALPPVRDPFGPSELAENTVEADEDTKISPATPEAPPVQAAPPVEEAPPPVKPTLLESVTAQVQEFVAPAPEEPPQPPKMVKIRRSRIVTQLPEKPTVVIPDTVIESPGCEKFYDPCTKEELADFVTLEKRVRTLKQQINIVPSGLYGLSNSTTNYDFLITVFINPEIALDDMVSFALQEGGNPGSDIFEVMSRLFVFFGGIKNVNLRKGGNYKFMKKIEGDSPEIYDDSVEALKYMKCKATRAMGISDITLVNVPEEMGVKKKVESTPSYCEVECDINTPDKIKTYLMSVKWYKKEKNAEHYDLEKLYTASQKITTDEQKPISIIVFLKSKKDFQIAHSRAYRQYVKEISDTFFGWEEDVKPFLQDIRREIFEFAQQKGITPEEAVIAQYLTSERKPSLLLQLHQDIIVKSICNSFDIANDKRYLIGVLPRGGKTFIAGGIIREYLNRKNPTNFNIFWITAAPNETKSQVQGELLDKFQDFADFDFIDVKTITEVAALKKRPHSVIFCSSQLLNLQTAGLARHRPFLESLLTGKDTFGLIFFDEAHKTGVGEKTKTEINAIITAYSATLPLIFLTATYYNILFDYQIQKDNTYIWDYTDVLNARKLATDSEQDEAIQNIRTRFNPTIVDEILKRRIANGDSYEIMSKAYIGFPDLYFLSADFQEEALQRFEEQNVYRPDAGFNIKTLFAIRRETTIEDIKTSDNKIRKDAYKIFENLTNPRNIISLLTPSAEPRPFDSGAEQVPEVVDESGEPLTKTDPELEPSILGRINKLSRDAGSRFRLDEHPTLLMFMPTGGTGSNIYYLLCAWASLLMQHKWWKEKYEVVCVVNDENISKDAKGATVAQLEVEGNDNIYIINKNPKANILALERKLHCSKQKGLVILAGEKLSMGISLPCTDVVFLFNDTKSPDDIIQKMYRGLTPSPGKIAAFVVDLNPVRTLAALYGYTRAANVTKNTASEILDIIYDTYSWDADIFEHNLSKGAEASPLTFQQRLQDLFNAAEKDPTNDYRITEDFGGFEKKLGENIRRQLDREFISKLSTQFTGKKMKDVGKRIGLTDDMKISLESGKLVVRRKIPLEDGDIPAEDGSEPPDQVLLVIDNFVESVTDFVKYLAITSNKNTFKEALEEYESNVINSEASSLQRNILKMVRSRTQVTGDIDDTVLSKLFITAVKDFSPIASESLFRQMRGKVDDKSLRKEKILQIIHRRLTPRQKQKKDFGEVFTPIELIEDMLSHLPKSDWSNPDLKWLDPANGIGNFPLVVFYKLDEGLKTWEPNEKKRRKHIIEKMLYMMELQSYNNRVAKNIFTSLCEGCVPNIWTTNTLKQTKENILEYFKIDRIDRVIGNPPFQDKQEADGKRGGGDSLYMDFVKLSINILENKGYLVFVHPPSWRKPEYNEGRKRSKNSGMFKLMAHDNQIEYLEIHGTQDGMRVFKAGTRYDFYILKKIEAHGHTTVKDINGETVEVYLRDFEFLPNFNIKNVLKLFPKRSDSQCELGIFDIKNHNYSNDACILYERSSYGSDKGWVSATESAEYKYPLIHSTNKDGVRYFYSNTKDKGMFGISKVIFGESGINDPVIDIDGKFGMTQGAMALIVKNKKDAESLITFLKSNYFKNIITACSWGGFRIDWRLFTYFRNDFWNINVNLDEKIIDFKEEPYSLPTSKKGGAQRFNKTRKNRK